MSVFKMPDHIEDSQFMQLQKHSAVVLKNLQEREPGKEIPVDHAIILAIFGVFNPENHGMSVEQVTDIFNQYVKWMNKKLGLN